jgi:hypothetical protein
MTSGGASVASARPASSCGHGPVSAGGPILTATTDSCRAPGVGHAVARRSGDLTIHYQIFAFNRSLISGRNVTYGRSLRKIGCISTAADQPREETDPVIN